MTSSSKDGHRQLHHDDPTYDVESSHESNSPLIEKMRKVMEIMTMEKMMKTKTFSGPPLAFTREESFTHMTLKMKIMVRN